MFYGAERVFFQFYNMLGAEEKICYFSFYRWASDVFFLKNIVFCENFCVFVTKKQISKVKSVFIFAKNMKI